MTRTVTLLSLLMLAGAAQAQPSFELANYPTSPVALTFYTVVDIAGTDPPSNGADQTWQYSALNWNLGGSVLLDVAAGTPYAGDYPTANATWTMTPSGGSPEYQYSVVDNTGFEVIATHVPAAPNVYTDHQRILQFPWAFNTSFFDGYASPEHTGNAVWTFDGYGTFITSLGTFTDQLKTTSSEGDVILWNASPIYPTLIGNSNSVLLFVPDVNAVPESGHADLRVYPDPCTDVLNVEQLPAGEWRITDMAGRTMRSGRSNGTPLQRLELGALGDGYYLLYSSGSIAPIRFVKSH